IEQYLQQNVHLLPQTNHLRALHTVIRDRGASREDFVLQSGRIIRLLVEASLDQLPFEPLAARTPVGEIYDGLRLAVPVCGVSVVGAGAGGGAGRRRAPRPPRSAKPLTGGERVPTPPRLYSSALPADIATRHVLLLDPMLATGGTARAAIQVLLDAGVPEQN